MSDDNFSVFMKSLDLNGKSRIKIGLATSNQEGQGSSPKNLHRKEINNNIIVMNY